MKKISALLFFISCYTLTIAQTFEWAKQLAGTYDIEGNGVAIDVWGNVYTTGNFTQTTDFDPGPGVFNLTTYPGSGSAYISKLDAAGNFIWARQLGGPGGVSSVSIAVDELGGVYTVGSLTGTVDFDPGPGVYNLTSTAGSIWYDIFISKLDSSGSFLWARSFGSYKWDKPVSVTADNLGNVYTTGVFCDTVDFDPGIGVYNLISQPLGGAIFINKLDISGNFVWAGQVANYKDWPYSITLDDFNNVYVTGAFRSPADFDPGPGVFILTAPQAMYDVFILKLNTAGNFVYAKQFTGQDADIGYSISVDAVGNVYTTGSFLGAVDFDPGQGIVYPLWQGSSDIFISKLDTAGNYVWVRSLGAGLGDGGLSIAVDKLGSVYTCGLFQGNVDFDPGPGTYFLNAVNVQNGDVFINKLDANGNFVWAYDFAGVAMAWDHTIAVDSMLNIYTTGRFGTAVDFDLGAGVYNLTPSSSGNSAFVHKMSQPITSVETQVYASLGMYPNPAASQLSLSNLKPTLPYSISVTDVLGNAVIYKTAKGTERTTVNVAALAAGVYFVVVEGDGMREVKKLVKQ